MVTPNEASESRNDPRSRVLSTMPTCGKATRNPHTNCANSRSVIEKSGRNPPAAGRNLGRLTLICACQQCLSKYSRCAASAIASSCQRDNPKSTRERASLRDSLVSLGVTMMSAGSHTEPGGYTRQGSEHLHRTVRGRIVAPDFQDGEDQLATGQFEISDERSPAEIAAVLRRRGFEPVWKDWDQALTSV